jgi:hypothetical protein
LFSSPPARPPSLPTRPDPRPVGTAPGLPPRPIVFRGLRRPVGPTSPPLEKMHPCRAPGKWPWHGLGMAGTRRVTRRGSGQEGTWDGKGPGVVLRVFALGKHKVQKG